MTPPDIAIRPARADEAAALAAFAARLFRDTYAPTCRAEDVEAYATAAFTPRKLEDELRDPGGATLVAEAEGEWAGYARIQRGAAPDGVPGTRPLELARLYVDARWHGRGVAAKLMGAVLAAAREWERDTVWLCVWERNERAIRFYRRLGFGVVGSATFQMGADLQRDHLMATSRVPETEVLSPEC